MSVDSCWFYLYSDEVLGLCWQVKHIGNPKSCQRKLTLILNMFPTSSHMKTDQGQQIFIYRGHCITNPSNALFQGKYSKTTRRLHCLILSKWVIQGSQIYEWPVFVVLGSGLPAPWFWFSPNLEKYLHEPIGFQLNTSTLVVANKALKTVPDQSCV